MAIRHVFSSERWSSLMYRTGHRIDRQRRPYLHQTWCGDDRSAETVTLRRAASDCNPQGHEGRGIVRCLFLTLLSLFFNDWPNTYILFSPYAPLSSTFSTNLFAVSPTSAIFSKADYIVVGHCCESGDLFSCAPGDPQPTQSAEHSTLPFWTVLQCCV